MTPQDVLGYFDAFAKMELLKTKDEQAYATLKGHLLSIRAQMVARLQSNLNRTIEDTLSAIQRPANL